MKILVVDDDKNILALTKHLLKNPHDIIKTTPSPLEAIACIIETKYDLLIFDIMMPIMDGCTLHQKAMKVQPELKTIGISGYPISKDDRETFDYFLPKPFKIKQLRHLVKKVSSATPS